MECCLGVDFVDFHSSNVVVLWKMLYKIRPSRLTSLLGCGVGIISIVRLFLIHCSNIFCAHYITFCSCGLCNPSVGNSCNIIFNETGGLKLCRFATLLGQFHLQKFISSFKGSASSHSTESPWMQNLMTHLCDKSLYALGLCSEFFIGPDRSLLLSSEAYGNKSGHRSKAVLHQEACWYNIST